MRQHPPASSPSSGRNATETVRACQGLTALGDQVLIGEHLAGHARGQRRQLLDGIQVADVVPAREFVHVAMQVLDAEVVKHALVRPLQRGPERVNPLRMRPAPDVFPGTVVDGFVAR